jgi:hypothetical protein
MLLNFEVSRSLTVNSIFVRTVEITVFMALLFLKKIDASEIKNYLKEK